MADEALPLARIVEETPMSPLEEPADAVRRPMP